MTATPPPATPAPAVSSPTKMQLNPDGSVGIPVLDGPNPRIIEIREPAFGKLAKLHVHAVEADRLLREGGQDDQGNELPDAAKARAYMQNDPERCPHGIAMVAVIELLTGETVDLNDLPGWVAYPDALLMMRSHFASPLPGDTLAGLLRVARATLAGEGSNRDGVRALARS